ncbi:uncharacterized protein LOC115990950 [Quercus lobata]|uniref:uncharacterized protein LOC115990950 n=1 Tax=Quercus lobata TaxID=97700 RepID=UPI001248A5E2|nr:uncharacterized protein LOC115990950 [Quercus lobata]
MFESPLGRSIEVYIDDMVVKSRVVFEHVGDLVNIFGILRKHKLRLNAFKCSFGVGSGKFLGYMVTHRGIEWKGFEWTEEYVLAFQQLKEYLSWPPIMSSLEVDEVLFAYLAVASHTGSPYFISNNGLQFDSKAFRQYCSDLGIKNRYSTPAYSQGNGQAETINKVIVNGLKKSLNLIEERRENAMVQLAYYQHKLKQGYDTNVKLRPLAVRDLVLRKVLGTTKNPA